MKIAIIGEMAARGYSGGRYHAWIMAEALAHENNQVYVIINNIPEFSKDFELYPEHKQIQVILANDFYDFEFTEKKLDYVICIPLLGRGKRFYTACLDFAVSKHSIFAFINFETPNWYHNCTEIVRDEKSYEILKNMCKNGCLIFCSANESKKFAVEYYNKYPDHTEYCVWSPPINSVMADKIKEIKKNQILIFLRIRDKHKGGDDFLKLMGEYLRGMTCVCVVGTGEIAQDFLDEAQSKAEKYGITLSFEKSLSDYRKFQEIKKSRLLLFPSHFEGYGYPPVEALYCGTRCIVYDLPVLREISGSSLTYCEMGNISEMQKKVEMLLKSREDMEPICVDTAEFTKQAERLQHILENSLTNEKLIGRRRFFLLCKGKLRKWYYLKVQNVGKYSLLPGMIRYCIDNDIRISEKLLLEQEQWKTVKKQLMGKDVYIWGCGNAYKEIFPKYNRYIRLKGILDSSPDKIGRPDRYKGILISNPNILCGVDSDKIAILISNKEHVDEIIQKLEEMKIRNYHSLCMIELNSLWAKTYKFIKKRGKGT